MSRNDTCTRRQFCFNPTATTQIYTLSLHDALPILQLRRSRARSDRGLGRGEEPRRAEKPARDAPRPDRKSTRLNSSHPSISYAVFCLKKKRGKRIDYRSLCNDVNDRRWQVAAEQSS